MLSERDHQIALDTIESVYLSKRTAANALFSLINRSVFHQDRPAYFLEMCESGESQLRIKYDLGLGRLADHKHLSAWVAGKSAAKKALSRGFDPRRSKTFYQFVKNRREYGSGELLKQRWNRWLNRLNNGEPELQGLADGISHMRKELQHRERKLPHEQAPESHRPESSLTSNNRGSSATTKDRKDDGTVALAK